jgi:S-methylmethionine-dependent homocysteine/selenocysteine methylase
MSLKDLLDAKDIVILDGAMGTGLYEQGVDIGLPLWSANALIRAPHVVRNIHFHMLHAGADILTTNTFRTNPRALRKAEAEHRWEELNLRAVELAFEARDRYHPARPVLVAGGLAPVEDCYSPDLVPSEEELLGEHGRQAELLSMYGADMLLVETMMTVREAAAAARACAATGKEFAVSFFCDDEGRLLSGERIDEAVSAVEVHAPSALLVNCVAPRSLRGAHRLLHASTSLPTGCYGNTGTPQEGEHEESRHEVDVAAFASLTASCVDDGARIVGGCCGTSPEHIEQLVRRYSPATLRFQEEEHETWLEARRNRYQRSELPDKQNFT